MARRPGRILPFRIPFFRIFYSTTYTTVYIICLCLLAITPVSMIWVAIENSAYQYTIMVGGTCILTALIAIFIFSSRLYTNRSVLVGVGKAYIPVEDGEIGKNIRKMIVNQFERSALIAWESRPRDLFGEILQAELQGMLPAETESVDRNDYTVGREIPVDPAYPPWGEVQHPGWSSPSHRDDNEMPDLQFATVIAELPNLIEARAVSLAPPDPMATPKHGMPVADPVVVDALRRPETMSMRDYLTQLSYLGLVNASQTRQRFLTQYEHARFGGVPVTETEFRRLMSAFAELLSAMTELDPTIVEQIYEQTGEVDAHGQEAGESDPRTPKAALERSSSSSHSTGSSIMSPVTARTGPSRYATPRMPQEKASMDSFSSVIHMTADDGPTEVPPAHRSEDANSTSSSVAGMPSDAGSVLRRTRSSDND